MKKRKLFIVLLVIAVLAYKFSDQIWTLIESGVEVVDDWSHPKKYEPKTKEGDSFFNNPLGVSSRLSDSKKSRYDDSTPNQE